jgi:hypothetical protein
MVTLTIGIRAIIISAAEDLTANQAPLPPLQRPAIFLTVVVQKLQTQEETAVSEQLHYNSFALNRLGLDNPESKKVAL